MEDGQARSNTLPGPLFQQQITSHDGGITNVTHIVTDSVIRSLRQLGLQTQALAGHPQPKKSGKTKTGASKPTGNHKG